MDSLDSQFEAQLAEFRRRFEKNNRNNKDGRFLKLHLWRQFLCDKFNQVREQRRAKNNVAALIKTVHRKFPGWKKKPKKNGYDKLVTDEERRSALSRINKNKIYESLSSPIPVYVGSFQLPCNI